MSGGIESMHEDEPRASCKGCNQPPRITELLLCYEATRKLMDPERKLTMTLELCHDLIIELANHSYCMHGVEHGPIS